MIDRGANPHIIDGKGEAQYDLFDFSKLENVPSIKSVFFPIKNFTASNLGDPGCYTTGVYDGKFGQVIGKGGEGTVIQGEFNGRPAAFKFVQVKGLKMNLEEYRALGANVKLDDVVADVNERLKEMTEMMATPGQAILPFEAHFR